MSENVVRSWRRLAKLYSVVSMPIDFLFHAASWRIWGVDIVSAQLKNSKVREAAFVVDALNDVERDQLTGLAQINAERAQRFFTAVAVGYLTIPVAAATLASGIAPQETRDFITRHLPDYLIWILVAAATPAFFFLVLWRARQIQWAIELARLGLVEPKARGREGKKARAGG